MKFDYSKTINEQLDVFDYYKNRYANYELTILKLQRETQKLKEKIKNIVTYAYGTDMLVCEYKQLCKIAEVE